MTDTISQTGGIGTVPKKSVPLVSVLVPVYNVERYLEAAIQSIQTQTLREIEIVAVDDGSTDGSLRLLKRLEASDPRIRVFTMERNSGIAKALNLGLKDCHGRYVARLDADDIALPNWIENQLRFLSGHPEIALAGTSLYLMNAEGTYLGMSPFPRTPLALRKVLTFASPCAHSGWIVGRDVYESLHGYRAMAVAQDYDFLLRAVTAGYRVANNPEPLIKVRVFRSGNAAGLRSCRANRIVSRLYDERVASGRDTFDEHVFADAIEGSSLENFLHQFARYLMKHSQGKILLIKCFCWALAGLISPWQTREFVHSVRWKLAVRQGKQQ